MSLVTDLSAGELQALQAEMQDPRNVERLHKKFPEAFKHAISTRTLPANISDEDLTEAFDLGWVQAYGGGPPGTTIVEVLDHPSGRPMYKVYHRDPERHEKAKSSQPEPGEKPSSPSFPNLFRLKDGTLVLREGNLTHRYIQLNKFAEEAGK